MSEDQAVLLAIAAMEAQIKTLAIDANLVDIWSMPQPTELITCDYRTPRRIAASEKRNQLRLAISRLEGMLSQQVAMFEIEVA